MPCGQVILHHDLAACNPVAYFKLVDHCCRLSFARIGHADGTKDSSAAAGSIGMHGTRTGASSSSAAGGVGDCRNGSTAGGVEHCRNSSSSRGDSSSSVELQECGSSHCGGSHAALSGCGGAVQTGGSSGATITDRGDGAAAAAAAAAAAVEYGLVAVGKSATVGMLVSGAVKAEAIPAAVGGSAQMQVLSSAAAGKAAAAPQKAVTAASVPRAAVVERAVGTKQAAAAAAAAKSQMVWDSVVD